MLARCCAFTLVLILSGTIGGCSSAVDDTKDDDVVISKDSEPREENNVEKVSQPQKENNGKQDSEPRKKEDDDGKKDSDANNIVYPPSRLADTSHPAVVTAIRPFLSRVRPEDSKHIAVHFATRYGPGKGRGLWQERVLWDTTLSSLTIVVKTPGGATFQIHPQPESIARITSFAIEHPYRYRRPLENAPTIFVKLPISVAESNGGQLLLVNPDELDMSIEGMYRISVRGTIDLQNEDIEDIDFTTAETTVEVTTNGVASIGDAIAAATGAKLNPRWDEKNDPSPIEDKYGNRIFRYNAGASGDWAYKQASILIRPDGTFERIAYKKIGTCIAEGSLVETEQGPLPVEKLTLGTKIWGFDLEHNAKVLTPLRQIRTHVAPRMLQFPSGLRVTADHPIWTDDSWKQAGDLRPDDVIRRFDGSLKPAGKPHLATQSTRVYDLTVDTPHNFFADGVLVHNKSRWYSPYLDDPWYRLWPQPERPADTEQASKADRVVTIGGVFQPRDDGGVGLYFDRDSKVTAANLAYIAGLKGVREIRISNDEAISDETLKSLRGFDELEWLAIYGGSLSDASLEHLGKLPALTRLNMPLNGLSEEGFRRLGRLTGLKSLSVNVIPDKASAAHLTSLRQLETLSLYGETIDDDSLEMVGSLAALRELRIGGASIQGPGMVHLEKLKKLEQLRITSCSDISHEGMRVLGQLPSLKYLEVYRSSTGGWCDALSDAKSLESLYLGSAGIIASDIKHLGRLTRLKHLSLSGAEMTDSDLQHLYGMKELQSLTLPKEITDAGIKRIQAKLPECKVKQYSF